MKLFEISWWTAALEICRLMDLQWSGLCINAYGTLVKDLRNKE